MADGRLKDRVVAAVAVRHGGPDREIDLDEAGMAANPVDLGRRHLRLLAGNDDRGTQPLLRRQPLCHMPVVDGRGQRRGGIGVMDALDAIRAIENRVLQAKGIKDVITHTLEVGACHRSGRVAQIRSDRSRGLRRIGILDRALERGLRDVLPPVLGEIRKEHLGRCHNAVDIGIDDRLPPRFVAHGRRDS
jgi:hypothetical protein